MVGELGHIQESLALVFQKLQEFKVQIGVYPAEFGHQSTQINVLTKSGGNAYHGSLFEFLRNDALDAQPYAFTSVHPKKSPFKWNDYGFELDGPVSLPKLYNGHDKLFFIANYEALRRRLELAIILGEEGREARICKAILLGTDQCRMRQR